MSLTTGFTFRFGLLPSSVAASGWDDFFLTNCRETARALLLVGIFWPDLAVLEGLPRVLLPEAGAVRRRPSDRGKTDGNFERFPQCFGPFICTWPVVSDLLDPDPYSEFRLDPHTDPYKTKKDLKHCLFFSFKFSLLRIQTILTKIWSLICCSIAKKYVACPAQVCLNFNQLSEIPQEQLPLPPPRFHFMTAEIRHKLCTNRYPWAHELWQPVPARDNNVLSARHDTLYLLFSHLKIYSWATVLWKWIQMENTLNLDRELWLCF